MSNTNATVNAALIAQSALTTLLAKFPVLGQIATDFSDASVKFNQDIVTHIVTPTVAQDFDPATGYVPDDQAQVDVKVKIDKHAYRVGKSELLALQRRLLKEVGWLAAGWNEAAKKLGVRLPAWVARHGSGRGSIGITTGATRFRIAIANEVGFVGNVKGFSRRIQGAINLQASAMKRQAEHLLKKSIRKAGFK